MFHRLSLIIVVNLILSQVIVTPQEHTSSARCRPRASPSISRARPTPSSRRCTPAPSQWSCAKRSRRGCSRRFGLGEVIGLQPSSSPSGPSPAFVIRMTPRLLPMSVWHGVAHATARPTDSTTDHRILGARSRFQRTRAGIVSAQTDAT